MTLADKKIALVHIILAMEKESILDLGVFLADKAINQIQTDNGNHLNDLEFYVGNIEDKVDIDKIRRYWWTISKSAIDALCLDSNVLLQYIRRTKSKEYIEETYNPFGSENTAIISIATVAEILSIAKQYKWERLN